MSVCVQAKLQGRLKLGGISLIDIIAIKDYYMGPIMFEVGDNSLN